MTAPLGAHMRLEQHAVTCFLGSDGWKHVDIHCRWKRQYEDTCLPLQQVYEWHRKFKNGVSGLMQLACSSWPHTTNMLDINSEVEQITQENWQVTINEVTGED